MTEDSLNPIAQAIAWDVSFVARGFSYKPNQLAELIAQGIRHKGFALIDAFSPCPTFNQDQTDDFYKDHTFDIPADHDPTDRVKAFELALSATGYPVGVFYKHEGKGSIVDEQATLRARVPRDVPASIDTLLGRYA